MNITLEEFHQDFLQTILSDAESRGLMRPQAFFENVCEELIGAGDLTVNYTIAEYIKNNMEVYGYDYDEERQVLSLLAHHFYQENEIQTLTLRGIDAKFKRLKSFITGCTDLLHLQMEETDPAYSMAYFINKYIENNTLRKIRLILVTDGKATRNLGEIPSEVFGDISIDYRVIDINYIYKLYLLENSGGGFEADVNLPYLKIPENEKYQSYLAVIQGQDLVNLYDNFGQKLFEQNVRTFLQFRGNVNKGLRNTIQYHPEMFFAYNNGITATATDVEVDSGGRIVKISNLQIVNGGQTTSAIYAACKNSKLDVADVAVQMKLSVVTDQQEVSGFVSKVAEYANTQNKINPSDFFSNSPFHQEFKEYSKRLRVPAVDGAQHQTHWFYERVRGEYLNEQAYLTAARRGQFLLENPKNQLFEKTFLAKCEVAWIQKPDEVSKGAQRSATVFAEEVTDMLSKSDRAITENYFRGAVAKVILFRFIEKMVSGADWYNQAYRAQTVAYTMSYLAYRIQLTGKSLNLDTIWNEQAVPLTLRRLLFGVAKRIYEYITTPKEGYGNPSQWCKKDACWNEIKALNFNFDIDENILIDKEEERYIARQDRAEKALDSGIEIQTYVVERNSLLWKELREYFSGEEGITQMQDDILDKMSSGKLGMPSEKQAKVIYKLLGKAKGEGFDSQYLN